MFPVTLSVLDKCARIGQKTEAATKTILFNIIYTCKL